MRGWADFDYKLCEDECIDETEVYVKYFFIFIFIMVLQVAILYLFLSCLLCFLWPVK